MSDPKWTPGPWQAGLDPNERAWNVYGADDSEYADAGDLHIVASYCTEANARLIAAAPRMYQALELCAENMKAVLRALRGEDMADAETYLAEVIGIARGAQAEARGEEGA